MQCDGELAVKETLCFQNPRGLGLGLGMGAGALLALRRMAEEMWQEAAALTPCCSDKHHQAAFPNVM